MQSLDSQKVIHQITERLLEAERLTQNADLKFLQYLVQMARKEAEEVIVTAPASTATLH